MAKLYLDRLEPFKNGQDLNFRMDVYDVDTGKRFAVILPTLGGEGKKWTIRFFERPSITDLSFEQALEVAHVEKEHSLDKE